MSMFSRLKAKFHPTERKDESHLMLDKQLKEFRQSTRLSPRKDPYHCLQFACARKYVLLIKQVLDQLDSECHSYEPHFRVKSALQAAVEIRDKEVIAALLDNRDIRQFPSFQLILSDCVEMTDLEMLRTLLFTPTGETRLLHPGTRSGLKEPIGKAFKAAIKSKNYDIATVLVEAHYQAPDPTSAAILQNGQLEVSFVEEALLELLTADSKPPAPKTWKDLARLLIKKGADVDTVIAGSSILQTVSARGLYDETVFLLGENADPNQKSESGSTPLFDLIISACKTFEQGRPGSAARGQESYPLIGSFLSHGAKLEIQNEKGDTPLYPAVRCRNYALLEILLKEAEAITSVNIYGETLVSIAAANNDWRSLELLIEKDNRLLNKEGPDMRTPLITAAERGSVENVQWLLDAGSMTDLKDNQGNTALHYAAAHKDTVILDLLLNSGASSTIRNRTDFYPVHCAVKAGSFATYRRLISANHSIIHGDYLLGLFVLTMAPGSGNVEILRDVLRFKPDVNHVLDDSGTTALHTCIDRDMLEHVKLLLENNADPNLKLNSGLAPLELALAKGRWEMAKYLLDNAADPRYSSNSEMLPINIACLKGQTDLVCQLINKGAYYLTRYRDNQAPLFSAIAGGSLDVVRILLKCGVFPDLWDPNTEVEPLEAAIKLGHVSIQRELRYYIANPVSVKSQREFHARMKLPGNPLDGSSPAQAAVPSRTSTSPFYPPQATRREAGSPFFNMSSPTQVNNTRRVPPETAATTWSSPSTESRLSLPVRQSFAPAPSRRDDADIVPELGMLEEVFGIAAQLGPMLENPQPTLRDLRGSSAARLRSQPRAKIELWNDFIYEVDPWDKEQLLDKLNGPGVRIFSGLLS